MLIKGTFSGSIDWPLFAALTVRYYYLVSSLYVNNVRGCSINTHIFSIFIAIWMIYSNYVG